MANQYLPDLRYLPDDNQSITSTTKLADGVSIGTFLKGVTLDHITELNDRRQVARNLMPHAHILKTIREDDTRFAKYKLVVVQGLYKPAPDEQITESDENHNFLAKTGRGVVYELRRDGKTDNEKTFELARYLQVFHRYYDKLILDYDNYNQGELNAQIIIQTPNIPSSYYVKFKSISETRFNNSVQAVGQLIETTEAPNVEVVIPAPLPDEVTGYFTVGDLHSRLLSLYGGDPWQSFAVDSRTSRATAIIENIKKVAKNDVVVISIGYNDAITTNDTPEAIAARVYNIVKTSIDAQHVVSFLLFRITAVGSRTRQQNVRNAILNRLGVFNNLNIIDLNRSQYQFDIDGQALDRDSYISVSDRLI